MVAAIVVFAPIDLVVTLATEAARTVAANADVLGTVLLRHDAQTVSNAQITVWLKSKSEPAVESRADAPPTAA